MNFEPLEKQQRESESIFEEEQTQKLKSTEKKFLWFNIGSSGKYTAVESSMETLVNELRRPIFSGEVDFQEFLSKHRNILGYYDRAITACKEYLYENSGIKFTKSGRSRKQIIYDMYQKLIFERDRLAYDKNVAQIFQRYLVSNDPSSIISWKDIISDIRIKTVDISGRTDISTTGGACSTVTIVGNDENQKFFKPREYNKRIEKEDIINIIHSHTNNRIHIDVLTRIFNRYPSEEIDEAIDLIFLRNLSLVDSVISLLNSAGFRVSTGDNGTIVLDNYKNIRIDNELMNDIYYVASEIFKNECIGHYCRLSRIQQGKELTSRNVATYRMGTLLNSEDLFVKSEKVYLRQENQVTCGIVMAKAKGKSVKSISEYIENNRPEAVVMGFSKKAQKQFCDLQIMDYITAQFDRNLGNYFVDYITYEENGVTYIDISSIQGIDNDMSFGNITINYFLNLTHGELPALKKEGKLSLPFLDKNLFESIKNVKYYELYYSLFDLLDDDEIIDTKQRCNDICSFIAQNYDDRQIIDEDQWNQETLTAILHDSEDNYLKSFYEVICLICCRIGISNVNYRFVQD